ncbi:MAG: alkyl sulfatase dimerization domain-containing protein [Dehalococcoidia bacterium]|jgi:alkyl sulfatase BDS1-like metallo-beta-lactamase superfamily hydrolase
MGLIKRPATVIAAVFVIIGIMLPAFSACEKAPDKAATPEISLGTQAGASEWTIKANEEVKNQFDFADREEFEDAQRGFIATVPDLVIENAAGGIAWSMPDYDFEKQTEIPATVNPLLWRHSQLNLNNGLYKVTDRIYQVRGFDINNMTIVEGDSKIIIIDVGMSAETAKAMLDLYYRERGVKPVAAIIYTHSHIDHFAGIKGIISDEDAKSGSVQIIAPEGFLDYAISENILAGNAMSRRAQYQFGVYLPRNAGGQVDSGGGKALPVGTMALIGPNKEIKATGEKLFLDGVEMEFQIVSGTEAPAAMTIYFPQLRALDTAEIASQSNHNLLTPRGAEVRDANAWAKAINEMIELYGDKTDVMFASQQWPCWGNDKIVGYLKQQRDLYKYTHDQTLRLLNHGYTPNEIAEMIKLPESLAKGWDVRDYYGTLSFNVRAVYQKYLGFYDGNPANLNPLPPVEASKKYVEYMGGPQAVIDRAKVDYANGDYRWVAQVMNQVVFAYPDNQEARNLEADAMEQLAYQAESTVWRNCYLVGASELRTGMSKSIGAGSVSPDMVRGITLPQYFDLMGSRLNGPKAEGKKIVINWNFTDTGDKYVLNLENSALTYTSGRLSNRADATLNLSRATLISVLAGETTFPKEILAGKVTIEGDALKILDLMGMMDSYDPMFNIISP